MNRKQAVYSARNMRHNQDRTTFHTHDTSRQDQTVYPAADSCYHTQSTITGFIDGNGQPFKFHRQSSFRKEHNAGQSIINNPEPKEAHEKDCVALEKQFDTVDKRLKSFVNYPLRANATPNDLAENGLFYVGVGDKVKCAYCKGQLYNWEPDDVPLEEHHRHFPECTFIKVRYQRLKEIAENNEIHLGDSETAKLLKPNADQEQQCIVQEDNRESPAIMIAKEMGLDENLIHKAYGILVQKGVKDIKSGDLLGVIFDLEDNPSKYLDIGDEFDIGATGGESIEQNNTNFTLSDSETSENNHRLSLNEGAMSGQNNTYVSLLNKKSSLDNTVLSLNSHYVQTERAPQHANAVLSLVQNNAEKESFEFYRNGETGENGIRSTTVDTTPSLVKYSNVANPKYKEGYSSPSVYEVKYNDNGNNLSRLQQQNFPYSNHQQNAIEVCDDAEEDNGYDSEENDTEKLTSLSDTNKSGKHVQSVKDNHNVVRSKCITSNPSKPFVKPTSKIPTDPNAIKELREQKTKLKQNVVCNVCGKNKINTLLLPCRHLVACEFCAAELNDCSRCSKKIIGTVKIFMI